MKLKFPQHILENKIGLFMAGPVHCERCVVNKHRMRLSVEGVAVLGNTITQKIFRRGTWKFYTSIM